MDFRKLKFFWGILTYKLIWLNAILGVVSILLVLKGFYFLMPVVYLFLSNLYDMLGYFVVLRRFWGLSKYEIECNNHKVFVYVQEGDIKDERIIAAYRIIQNMFDWLLFLFIWVTTGIKYAIAGKITKWFAAQDILFYLFLKVKLPEIWTWLEWTPLGLIKKGEGLKNREVINQAIVGIILAMLISLI